MVKLYIIFFISITLSGCTFAGVVLDSSIYSKADENYDADLALSHPSKPPKSSHVIKGEDTVSFSNLGFEFDSYLVGLLIEHNEPELVCKQVSKSLKVCEEVDPNLPTEDKNINVQKTVDEIIGVRQ